MQHVVGDILKYLEWLLTIPNININFNKAFEYACLNKKLDGIIWLIQNKMIEYNYALQHARSIGHIELVKWFNQNQTIENNNSYNN